MREGDISKERCCGTKVKYFSKANAEKVRRKVRKNKDLKVYQCPACGFWHYGHTTADRKAKGREWRR